ncbi:alpha-1,4-glucan:maltose-1-phosphate maltosyltransferase [Bacteroidota bacterium]|nr:alpha-1,4-glucan:maltose-1-phosphate maltosyltransferase [Bacteroidota bacterium]
MDGKSRVVIEKVSPEIDGGRFYSKAVLGDSVVVEADIFGDGHDITQAILCYRHEKQKNFREVHFSLPENDRCAASFIADTKGLYICSIKAWVDHTLTWHHGIKRKIAAGEQVAVELAEGAQLLTQMIEQASKADAKQLKLLAELFLNKKKYDAACLAASEDAIHHYAYKYPLFAAITTYPVELNIYVDRPRAGFSTWYELFPRSTSSKEHTHGTFNDVIKLLPRLNEMGFDVLYLPPVHPIGDSYRKGKNNNPKAGSGEPGSPWAIGNADGGHKAIHKDLGTLGEFKKLVNEADKYGIEIAMDYALQCAPEHPYVKEHPQWFKWRSDGTVQYAENPPKKYQDVLPIHFETDDWKNLWIELKGILQYWIKQGVKIFRVDNPHTKPFIFWEWIINEIKKEHPDVLFLSEAFTRPKVMQQLAKVGFSQSYTYYTWRTSKAELIEYMTTLTQTEMKNYFRPNFWPNTPDILPYNLQSGLEAVFFTRFFLAATLSSNYGFYGPVFEFMVHDALPGKEEYYNSEKYEISKWDWSKKTRFTELISKVNQARSTNKALQSTNNIQFCDIANDQLLSYFKQSVGGDNQLLFVVNLDPYHKQDGWLKVPLKEAGLLADQEFTVHDVLTGSQYVWKGEWNYVALDPHVLPFHLFRLEKK